jgi:hypothetical protein
MSNVCDTVKIDAKIAVPAVKSKALRNPVSDMVGDSWNLDSLCLDLVHILRIS